MESVKIEFLRETKKDGTEGVALFQTLPKPGRELMADEALMIRLLEANGLKDIKSFTLGDKIPETAQHIQKATISFTDETSKEPLNVLIKFNRGGTPEAVASEAWREAYFYSKVIPEHIPNFVCPKLYLALADKALGEQFIVIEQLKESVDGLAILIDSVMGKDIQDIGGPELSIENYLVQVAKNLAVLHSNTFIGSNQELVAQTQDIFPSAQWVQGKGKEKFDQTADSLRKILAKTLDHKNGLDPKDGPFPGLFQAGFDKIDFDAYQADLKLTNDAGIPYALTLGIMGLKDLLWSKTTSSSYNVDFEFVGYGPIVSDLCALSCGMSTRVNNDEAILKAYHDKLTELGKIDTTVYTLERLTNDFHKYMTSSLAMMVCKVNLKFNEGAVLHFTLKLAQSVEKLSITTDNILPIVFNNDHILQKPKAPEFDLEMETGPDGKQRVKMCQPMPFTKDMSLQDEDLVKKLLVANGLSEIKEVELSNKIAGGMSQEVALATCYNNDGSKFRVFIKANDGIKLSTDKQWREALFYADIMKTSANDDFRKNFGTPKCYLAMVDQAQQRQLMFLEYFEPEHYVFYETIYACENGSYYSISGAKTTTDTPIEEIAGPGVTKMETILSIIDNIAALHYYHWNDKTLFEKYPYLRMNDWYQGQGEERYNTYQTEKLGILAGGLAENGFIMQNYPELGAVFKACYEKGKSFQNFKDTYVNDPNLPFTLIHGDVHDKQLVWSKTQKRALMYDFELTGFSPAVTDICYFLNLGCCHIDLDHDEILEHYYKALNSFGDKVSDYSKEQLKKDFVRFFIPKIVTLTVMFCAFITPNEVLHLLLKNATAFIKKHDITAENVLPLLPFH